MSISRRKFVKTATLVAISAGIPLKVLASNSSSANAKISHSLSGSTGAQSSLDSETFSRYLNTQFTLRHEQTEAKFTLREVRHWTSSGSKKSAQGRECFSLIFDNAGKERLPQETYTASHSALGEFPLFVVPPAGNSQKKYEALFNRLHG